MKICFVGPASSSHIVKWCNWFCNRGHEVHVISFTQGEIQSVIVHHVDVSVDADSSDIKKLKYLISGRKIRQFVDLIKPDIVSVHYASSYGVAVALSGLKGYILSVWGSDIYAFPKKSFLHRLLLQFSLYKADCLLSTSQAMSDEAAQYTKKSFLITPFGVDMEMFNPKKRTRTQDDQKLVIGTVKTLSKLYGIDYLLKAAAIVVKHNPEIDLSIKIAGDGPNAEEYRELSKKLGIAERTFFLGRISQESAAIEWANMDIGIIPSVLYESFGVAAVEAEASGIPVIVTDVGGLIEVTVPGESSIVVPRQNEEAIAKAIIELWSDTGKKRQMGTAGREYAKEHYELNNCFNNIESIFFKRVNQQN